jgi:hypothetical protein
MRRDTHLLREDVRVVGGVDQGRDAAHVLPPRQEGVRHVPQELVVGNCAPHNSIIRDMQHTPYIPCIYTTIINSVSEKKI